jgi:Putative transposase
LDSFLSRCVENGLNVNHAAAYPALQKAASLCIDANEDLLACEKSFLEAYGTGSRVHGLRYLGAYTHRVAISNSRLVAFSEGNVTFRWRDFRSWQQEAADDSARR